MGFLPAVTPAGRLTVLDTADDDFALGAATPEAIERQLSRFAGALAADQANGLFRLATEKVDFALPPSWAFWRGLAVRYLTALCHTPEAAPGAMPDVPPPSDAELALLVSDVPPMPGAEYINESALRGIWEALDRWVREQVVGEGGVLASFLERHAPLWHQVGRVSFHLAENRQDADRPFAFLATYASGVRGGSRLVYRPLSEALREYAGARNKNALLRLLAPVHRASQQCRWVENLMTSGDLYQPLAWSPAEAYCFLQSAPQLEDSGILVRLPDWWKKRPRPRVSVTIGDMRQQSFGAASMLDFKVECVLGDAVLSEDEWRRLLDADNGLVLLRGQWVEVNREKLEEALDHWRKVERQADDGISFVEGMRLLAGVPADLATGGDGTDDDRQWSFVTAGAWLGEILTKLRSPENDALSAVADLKATMRPYQAAGAAWLRIVSGLGLGACLADDMGLGKTLQVLALLLALQPSRTKPSLLVLPASLLANWKAEIARFTPTLRTAFIHPAETPREEIDRVSKRPTRMLGETDLAVTTYGMLLRQPWLLDIDWRLAILDEAQAIKNPSSRQTRTVKRLRSEARIALTGTPVENRLGDLWSLFDFLCPGLLGSQTKFKEFVKRLGERQENRYAPLRSLVRPYILRRLKTDRRIIDDLPDKTEVQAYCLLSKRQAVLYAKLVEELRQHLANADGMQRRGIVLAYLMRFKQLCNHPSQLVADGSYKPEDSGKFLRLAEIVEEIASRQERMLLFTQFRELTEPLAAYLTRQFGRTGLVLHGGTAVKRRQKLIDQFQRDDGPPFFILSLKAGGTGLNLTAASHVIHFDRWWNPAVENQATDRAFRIGQKRNVLVHKFVCRGTIEERIDALIAEKCQLAAELLEGGAEKLLSEMNDEELIRFVSLDINRTDM